MPETAFHMWTIENIAALFMALFLLPDVRAFLKYRKALLRMQSLFQVADAKEFNGSSLYPVGNLRISILNS